MKLKRNKLGCSDSTGSSKFERHRTSRMSRSNIYSSAFPTTLFVFMSVLFVFVSIHSVISKTLNCIINNINAQQHKDCNCKFNYSVFFGKSVELFQIRCFLQHGSAMFMFWLNTRKKLPFFFLVHARLPLISDVGTAFLPAVNEHND